MTTQKIEVGATIFGVTSHHYVIPMCITKIEQVSMDNYAIVHVAASNLKYEYEKRQVELVFNDLLLIDGKINNQSVFLSQVDAKSFAQSRLQRDEEHLLQKLDSLKRRKMALQQ